MFNYDRSFNQDGITYAGQLHFRSVEAHYDWFPFSGSFHLSPGVLVYNGNQLAANASVPGGKTFTLNHTTYASDPTDPINGTGKVDFAKAGPMLTVGWGNLLPRNRRHFSFPFEVGVIYTGAPRRTQPERKHLRRCRGHLSPGQFLSRLSGKRAGRKR
jgi:hypothetical protein